MSPFLFSVFIDDVLINLHQSKLGCHINLMCFNSFMFADDLILLAISVCDMQKMVELCKTELDWLDMRINTDKSSCIRIGKRFNV